ncbi:DNA replication and repair protein RecF [Reticulibacter mediterranei]|uniref:DNA replication and repair protein RecF n=1 Tax=Reticulibacter mediterranei TaxID=2778369 RepID=A0A8J3MZA6_9CHLR|nr:DNA replication/repair protein RecF [Reticulibacter mediterranei]GHO92919.1 DNA replication and repair protein RecF [Reticulibacter mediterranei]
MYLSHLSLSNFRNYEQLTLSLSPGLFIYYGENAQGKTNLLEAVGMLATVNSFHASSDREVVNWHAPDHIARLEGTVKRREDDVHVEIALFDPTPPAIPTNGTTPAPTMELPASTQRKRLKINSIPRRTIDVIGQMKVVLFAPLDLHLVDGSPEERRRFLDRALCQIQPRYCQAIVKYRKIVTQRSALLKRIRENLEDPRMLDFLDEQMTQLASQIIYERQHMIEIINQQVDPLQTAISGGREHLRVIYRPSFKVDAAWNILEAQEQYQQQLRDSRKKEIHQGVCLLGPHRDDLEFVVNGINVLTYGSRGQQRTAALSTKLAELNYMRLSTGDEPVLLLDDVFSELDHWRREYLLQQVMQHEQVLLTTTDLDSFPREILQKAYISRIEHGAVQQEQPTP